MAAPLNPAAVKAANAALWKTHPEMHGRQLTMDPKDAALRKEWMGDYNKALAKASGKAVGSPSQPCPFANEQAPKATLQRPAKPASTTFAFDSKIPTSRAALIPISISATNGGVTTPAFAAPPLIPAGQNWKRAAKDATPKMQSYLNCGIQSARLVIEQALGQKLPDTELEFMEKAIKTCGAEKAENHPSESGGVKFWNLRCILEQQHVASKFEVQSIANIDYALRERKGVLVTVDSDVLWKEGYQKGQLDHPDFMHSIPGVREILPGKHIVVITDAEYNQTGDLVAVWINDPGVGERYKINCDILSKSLLSWTPMVVTDNSIWPVD